MLILTEPAQKQFKVVMASGEVGSSRLRVFIDHRCHCGKAPVPTTNFRPWHRLGA